MKREDLQKIEGITKEQIDSIMNLHQTDVTDWNKKIQDKDTEIKTKDTKITELSDTVKKFDGVDVGKLQQDVKDWEKKYQEDLTTAKKEAAIKLAIVEAKPKSEKALMAFLDTDIIKLNEDGTVTGLKEQLENIKKDNGFLFDDPDTKPVDVNLGGSHGNEPQTKESTWESALDDHYGKE